MKKRIFALFAAMMILVLSFSFFASAKKSTNQTAIPETRQLSRLNDEAGLLNKTDRKSILAALNEKSEEMQFDFVIAFVNSTDGQDITAFADDYFDYNGFGYGEDSSGIALVVCMSNRKYAVSACGEGTKYFTTSRCDAIVDAFISDLKSGDYTAVCNTFLEESSGLLERGRDGFYDDTDVSSSTRIESFLFNWKTNILIPIAVGIILAVITVAFMTSGLKSVRKKESAADYEIPGSLNITRQEDAFLYRNVTRTAIPKDNDSGGGSHTSSSGRSHTGTSGSF